MCEYAITEHQCGHHSAPYPHPNYICQAADNRPPIGAKPDVCPSPEDVRDITLRLGAASCCSPHCCTQNILLKLQNTKATRTTYLAAHEVLRLCRNSVAGYADEFEVAAYANHQSCHMITQIMPQATYRAIAEHQIQAIIEARSVTANWAPNTFWAGWEGRDGIGQPPNQNPNGPGPAAPPAVGDGRRRRGARTPVRGDQGGRGRRGRRGH